MRTPLLYLLLLGLALSPSVFSGNGPENPPKPSSYGYVSFRNFVENEVIPHTLAKVQASLQTLAGLKKIESSPFRSIDFSAAERQCAAEILSAHEKVLKNFEQLAKLATMMHPKKGELETAYKRDRSPLIKAGRTLKGLLEGAGPTIAFGPPLFTSTLLGQIATGAVMLGSVVLTHLGHRQNKRMYALGAKPPSYLLAEYVSSLLQKVENMPAIADKIIPKVLESTHALLSREDLFHPPAAQSHCQKYLSPPRSGRHPLKNQN